MFMWIKSLDDDVWININHITHFSIVKINAPAEFEIHETHAVTAFLDASSRSLSIPDLSDIQEQASVSVYAGTSEECEQFIRERIGLQTAWQWIGYLFAGGVGAVLTLIFS